MFASVYKQRNKTALSHNIECNINTDAYNKPAVALRGKTSIENVTAHELNNDDQT